jgi:hypothetical protein
MSEHATCALCGVEGHDLDYVLVCWVEPVTDPWQAVDRCPDRIACRLRVEADGEAWPVADSPRDADAWAHRGQQPPPPPPPAERPAVAPKPPRDGRVQTSDTWVDEPEEERSWI